MLAPGATTALMQIDGVREKPLLLFVVNAAWFFVSHRLPLAVAARENGYDVHVAAAPDETVKHIERAGISFHPVAFDRRGGNPMRETAVLLALVRLYRHLRPDLIHHVTIKPVLYGGIAARLVRVPAVIQAVSGLGYTFLADGVRASISRRAIHLAYRMAFGHTNQTVIFQNVDDRSSFVDSGVVSPGDAVIVRGSGVDTNVFRPAAAPACPPIVVLAARMLWHKGVAEFVDSARMLRRKGVSARFVLVGGTDPGNPSAIPVETLREWVAEGDVEWWGHRTDMAAVFNQSAIACLPSYREGLPKALIEAAACGLPIVTTDVPGCRDVVTRDNGLAVPRGSATELATAIARLLDDPALRARMGQRGRDMVLAEFRVESVVAEVLQIYDDRLKASRRNANG